MYICNYRAPGLISKTLKKPLRCAFWLSLPFSEILPVAKYHTRTPHLAPLLRED